MACLNERFFQTARPLLPGPLPGAGGGGGGMHPPYLLPRRGLARPEPHHPVLKFCPWRVVSEFCAPCNQTLTSLVVRHACGRGCAT